MSFDDNQLPENTLNLVEPYLKKPSFDPDTLERKTQNAACGSLCKWVRGVVRFVIYCFEASVKDLYFFFIN